MGHIDVLINNAGLGGSKSVIDMEDDEWHRVIDVTLTGTMRMTRAVLKHMQSRGKGVIVNNASVLGWRAQTEQAHYVQHKGLSHGFYALFGIKRRLSLVCVLMRSLQVLRFMIS